MGGVGEGEWLFEGGSWWVGNGGVDCWLREWHFGLRGWVNWAVKGLGELSDVCVLLGMSLKGLGFEWWALKIDGLMVVFKVWRWHFFENVWLLWEKECWSYLCSRTIGKRRDLSFFQVLKSVIWFWGLMVIIYSVLWIGVDVVSLFWMFDAFHEL